MHHYIRGGAHMNCLPCTFPDPVGAGISENYRQCPQSLTFILTYIICEKSGPLGPQRSRAAGGLKKPPILVMRFLIILPGVCVACVVCVRVACVCVYVYVCVHVSVAGHNIYLASQWCGLPLPLIKPA